MTKRKRAIILACVFWTLTACAYALDEESEFLRMCQYGTQEQQRTIKAIAAELKIKYDPHYFAVLFTEIRSLDFLYIIKEYQIKDITPLIVMKKIKVLGIINNDIEDLKPLAKLNTLESLIISKNSITNLSPVSGLENLRELDISRNKKIWDLRPLEKMIKLEIVSAGNNNIKDISPLIHLS